MPVWNPHQFSTHQLKEALTTTARHDGESLLTAAAGGGNLLVFDRVVGLLDGKVRGTLHAISRHVPTVISVRVTIHRLRGVYISWRSSVL